MMQGDFAGNSNITVRQIHFEDWEAYREFYMGLSKPNNFAAFFQDGQDMDDPETYRKFFAALDNPGSSVIFGAYDGEKMVGQTSLYYDRDNVAVFAGSERADAYRGKRIGDMLYEARIKHLRETGFVGQVLTTIRPNNEESHKAAARHGFSRTGEMTQHGHEVLMLDTL
jgi:RimJ/RimL family protein N-acetyltransferase